MLVLVPVIHSCVYYLLSLETLYAVAVCGIVYYSAVVGERSIVIGMSVCLSVREHISGADGPIFTKFCVPIPCGHGSVLLGRRCDTLCTSGLMDDVTFGRSGPGGPTYYHQRRCDTGAESDAYECLVLNEKWVIFRTSI